MAFTTAEFPKVVFENKKEYEEFKEKRKKFLEEKEENLKIPAILVRRKNGRK